MIYLCHSQGGGVPYSGDLEDREMLGATLGAFVERQTPTLLLPGRYRLTSGFSGESFYLHHVEVCPDGRGIFMVLSIRFSAEPDEKTSLFLPVKTTEFKRVVLPDQRPFMMVAIRDRDDPGTVYIMDLVYYFPEEEAATVSEFLFSLN